MTGSPPSRPMVSSSPAIENLFGCVLILLALTNLLVVDVDGQGPVGDVRGSPSLRGTTGEDEPIASK